MASHDENDTSHAMHSASHYCIVLGHMVGAQLQLQPCTAWTRLTYLGRYVVGRPTCGVQQL